VRECRIFAIAMVKTGILFGLLAATVAGRCHAYQVMNLIYNGSFEIRTSDNGTPSGWRFFSASGVDKSIWGHSPCTGKKDYYFDKLSKTGDTCIDNRDHMVPVAAGSAYKFRFMLKGSDNLNVTVGFSSVSTGAQSISTHNFNTKSGSWTLGQVSAKAPTGGPSLCWIAFRVDSPPGWLDVDDVQMILDPGPPTYPDAYCNLSTEISDCSDLRPVSPAGERGSFANTVFFDKECAKTGGTTANTGLSACDEIKFTDLCQNSA